MKSLQTSQTKQSLAHRLDYKECSMILKFYCSWKKRGPPKYSIPVLKFPHLASSCPDFHIRARIYCVIIHPFEVSIFLPEPLLNQLWLQEIEKYFMVVIVSLWFLTMPWNMLNLSNFILLTLHQSQEKPPHLPFIIGNSSIHWSPKDLLLLVTDSRWVQAITQ